MGCVGGSKLVDTMTCDLVVWVVRVMWVVVFVERCVGGVGGNLLHKVVDSHDVMPSN